MAEVINLAERVDDNRFVTVENMLQEATDDYRAEKLHGKHAVLVLLDRGPHGDAYDVGFRACNMRKSEMVSLLTVLANRLSMELTSG